MTKSTLLSHVAAEVRAEMARQRVTQRQLADALDLSQPQVSERLHGNVAFNIPELAATAEFLRVPITQFLGDGTGSTYPTGPPNPRKSSEAILSRPSRPCADIDADTPCEVEAGAA